MITRGELQDLLSDSITTRTSHQHQYHTHMEIDDSWIVTSITQFQTTLYIYCVPPRKEADDYETYSKAYDDGRYYPDPRD